MSRAAAPPRASAVSNCSAASIVPSLLFQITIAAPHAAMGVLAHAERAKSCNVNVSISNDIAAVVDSKCSSRGSLKS